MISHQPGGEASLSGQASSDRETVWPTEPPASVDISLVPEKGSRGWGGRRVNEPDGGLWSLPSL